jgi:hypothetical protein
MPIPQRRLRRDYRQLRSPTRFLSFNQKVKRCLSDTEKCPDSIWRGNLGLRQQYFEKVEQLEVSYHLASDGGKSLIRDRDRLSEEIVGMLDEIASLLEAEAGHNPDLLLNSGFTVTRERRSANRTRLPLAAPTDFTVMNLVEGGTALGSCSPTSGAFNQEIHVNTKDPSVEKDWFHKGIYADSASMRMEALDPGNTFFRSRFHGPDGPGPWSPTVTLTVT